MLVGKGVQSLDSPRGRNKFVLLSPSTCADQDRMDLMNLTAARPLLAMRTLQASKGQLEEARHP